MATRVLQRDWDQLSPSERHVLEHAAEHVPITRDTNQEFSRTSDLAARAADAIAAFGGSWTFVLGFVACLVAWVALNSFVLARAREAFDPFPYILLNLFLSMVAALQAPIILMSQNRHSEKDRLDAGHDYEVNLKSEIEIHSLHEKLDDLRQRSWAELVAMQQRQIQLLEKVLATRPTSDPLPGDSD
ncbi:MAG TPA: DUF1003 domain-containing protein [Longimicrobiales bacterium]